MHTFISRRWQTYHSFMPGHLTIVFKGHRYKAGITNLSNLLLFSFHSLDAKATLRIKNFDDHVSQVM